MSSLTSVTLFSLLIGLHQKDSGEICINGKKMPPLSPQEAVNQGILLLGQNQPMFRDLKVYENIYFGNEITKGRILDNAKMRQEATALLARLNIPINPMAVMGELGYAQQQLVQLQVRRSEFGRLHVAQMDGVEGTPIDSDLHQNPSPVIVSPAWGAGP